MTEAEQERAAVVAWLRATMNNIGVEAEEKGAAFLAGPLRHCLEVAITCIQRGDHLEGK